jgi:hypothetical protein
MKLTGAAILVSRGMKVLQAAPAAYPYRSRAEGGILASDFGSSASIYRSDGRPPQPKDEERVLAVVSTLQSAEQDRISPFADLELVVGSCQDGEGIEGIDLRLTSYFLEDDDNEAQEDAIIARDEAVAQQFADALQKALGDKFRVESYSGNW